MRKLGKLKFINGKWVLVKEDEPLRRIGKIENDKFIPDKPKEDLFEIEGSRARLRQSEVEKAVEHPVDKPIGFRDTVREFLMPRRGFQEKEIEQYMPQTTSEFVSNYRKSQRGEKVEPKKTYSAGAGVKGGVRFGAEMLGGIRQLAGLGISKTLEKVGKEDAAKEVARKYREDAESGSLAKIAQPKTAEEAAAMRGLDVTSWMFPAGKIGKVPSLFKAAEKLSKVKEVSKARALLTGLKIGKKPVDISEDVVRRIAKTDNSKQIYKELLRATAEKSSKTKSVKEIEKLLKPSPITKEITKAKAEGKSAIEVSNVLQKKIDNEIDKGIAKGLSFKKANDTTVVKNLFKARDRADNIDVNKLRKELFDKIPTDTKMKKFIIEKQFQLRENDTILEISKNNIKKFIDNPKETKRTLLEDILRDRNIDKNIFNQQVSGLTKKGRTELVKKLEDEVNGIYNSVKDTLPNFESTKLSKSQLKQLWGEGAKKPSPITKPISKEARKAQNDLYKEVSIKWGSDDYLKYLKDEKFINDLKSVFKTHSEPVTNFKKTTSKPPTVNYRGLLEYKKVLSNYNKPYIKTEKGAIDWVKKNRPEEMSEVLDEIKKAKSLRGLQGDYISFAIGYDGKNALKEGVSKRPLSISYAGKSSYEGQKVVKQFGKNTGSVFIHKNSYVLPIKGAEYSAYEKELVIPTGSKIRNIQTGYTGFGTRQFDTFVDTPNITKTKSQLTDIFNKAKSQKITKPISKVEDIVPTKATAQYPKLLEGAKEPKLLEMGREPTVTEAKRIFRSTGATPEYQNVLTPSKKVMIAGKEIVPRTKGTEKTLFTRMDRQKVRTEQLNLVGDTKEFKDISNLEKGWKDVYRNTERVFGKSYNRIKKAVLDPFDEAKGNFADEITEKIDTLENVTKNLKINNKKDRRLIQLFGEKQIKLTELKSKTGNWKNVIKADKWFRNQYETLLVEVNKIRKQIYPNDPSKIIPKRKNYYRHFRDIANEYMSGLKNVFETPAGISPELSGISEFTKPKSKWLSFAQKRLGAQTDIDAISGYTDYIYSSSYAKHVDPQIGRFKNLKEALIEKTSGEKDMGKLNNYIEYLSDFSGDLAGKTNPLDRAIQKYIPGGRKMFKVIDWVNKRAKANVILGNASSSIAQFANIPQGIAENGLAHSARGLITAGVGMFKKNKAIAKSNFVNERYLQTSLNRLDIGVIKNTKKFAAWMTMVGDEIGTSVIWNGAYSKALSKGIKSPIKYADDITRKMVAGRGVGEVPLAQKSKLIQIVAPFQVEVGNIWNIMGDNLTKKEFGKLAKFFVYSHIFNKAAEKVRGSDVVFDPINAALEAGKSYKEEEDKTTGLAKIIGRMSGEVLSNIPLGQSLAFMIPEAGVKIPFKKDKEGKDVKISRSEFFGEGDPFRFGGGLVATRGLQDPLYKLAPPFGGQQAKRTKEGLGAVKKGYSETKGGRVRFSIDKTLFNTLKAGVFGQYSTPEAREYFEKELSPLGESASERVKAGETTYEQESKSRAEAKEEREVRATTKEAVENIYDEISGLGEKEKRNRLNKLSPEEYKAYRDIVSSKKSEKKQTEAIVSGKPQETPKERAEYIFEQLKELPPQKAEYHAEGMVGGDEAVGNALKRIIEEEAKGITNIERTLKGLEIEERTPKIKDIFSELEGLEKKEKAQEYYNKEILTEGVIKEFIAEEKGSGAITDFITSQNYSDLPSGLKSVQKKAVYEKLKKYPTAEVDRTMAKMKNSEHALWLGIKQLVKEERLRMTDQEKKIKAASYKPRAKLVSDNIKGMSQAERNKYMARMAEIGVIPKGKKDKARIMGYINENLKQ